MPDAQDWQAYFYRVVTANGLLERMVDAGELTDAGGGASINTGGRGLALEDFSLAARLQAARMGEVYELLYCLENSVRELIEQTLREKHGTSWWDDGVPESIRKSAEKKKQDDLKSRWHGPRGESLLNYVDFPQYGEIIVDQWDLFEDLLGDPDWVTAYFSEMNTSRRALAHTGSLTQADVERMDLRVRDWLRVVG
jgi:Swt1-like HEPN